MIKHVVMFIIIVLSVNSQVSIQGLYFLQKKGLAHQKVYQCTVADGNATFFCSPFFAE